MTEIWHVCEDFPEYQVSTEGRVRGHHGRILKPTYNQGGHPKVNLYSQGVVYTRQVATLVLVNIAGEHRDIAFKNVIHLNGEKADCRYLNLMWRPHHFAVRYHSQFDTPSFKNSDVPIREVTTGEEFARIQEAVVKYGLLFNDILVSMNQMTVTWPGFRKFEPIV